MNSGPMYIPCPLLFHAFMVPLSKTVASKLAHMTAVMSAEVLQGSSQLSTKVADMISPIGQNRGPTMWSYISEQLVSNHEVVYQQHEVFMRQWGAVKDLLDREREQDDNRTRQLEEKEAELVRLRNSLTDQSKIIQQYRQCSVRFGFATQDTGCTFTSGVDSETLHDMTLMLRRDEWPKGQALTSAQRLANKQKTQLADLQTANTCLQSQLDSVTSRLKVTETGLEAARTRCANAECCAHPIAKLNDRAVTAEAKVTESQRMMESLQKENHDHKKALTRLKRKRQTKDTEYSRQLKLRKTEYCDLQRDFDELNLERQHLLDQLNEETIKSAAHSAELEAVNARTNDLEVKRSELQRRFDAADSEHHIMKRKATAQASKITVLEQKLAVAKANLSEIRLQAENSHELRQCSEGLQKLELTPERFCDPSHRKFSYLTDCGRLLCKTCVPTADDTCLERDFGAGAGQHWEFDECPWCHADMWSCQKLDVPFSLDYVQEFSTLWKIVNASLP